MEKSSFYDHRGMEQLVARRAHNPKVAGSSPAPATKIIISRRETEIGSARRVLPKWLRSRREHKIKEVLEEGRRMK